jgi:hypothetical protein
MGVYWESNAGGMNKWHAQIMVDKRVYNLGKYHDEEAAAQVYAKAKRARHREECTVGWTFRVFLNSH